MAQSFPRCEQRLDKKDSAEAIFMSSPSGVYQTDQGESPCTSFQMQGWDRPKAYEGWV
jgi:hypothetical protein